jgi:hypothetical protein
LAALRISPAGSASSLTLRLMRKEAPADVERVRFESESRGDAPEIPRSA